MSKVPRKDKTLEEVLDLLDMRLAQAGGDLRRAFSTLTGWESDFINDQIERCTDFRYYAENYHVIGSEEEGFKTLYPFWDSQEIFYEKIRDLQLKKLPAKVIVLKARQLGLCLSPETKILTADLRWVSIDEVGVGDRLVAVDENVPGGRNRSRKMWTAVALAKREVFEPAFRITMDSGVKIVSTAPHRFLCKVRGAVHTCWRSVSDMRVGDEIRYVTEPWDSVFTYDDGWFGGMIDGEGSLSKKSRTGAMVSVSQVHGEVYDRAFEYLSSRGYSLREENDDRKSGESSKFGDRPVGKVVVGRMNELFRLIGQTRPTRFIGRLWWEGKDLPGKNSGKAWSKITAIESLPAQRMIDLQTTTKTFIAEGLVSHNSTVSEALIFHKTIFREGCNTLVVAQDPGQADYLFGMARTAYDSLPWWMRPEARYEAKGRYLVFDRKDPMERLTNPGLKSQIFVEAANKMTGVAVGRTVHAAHMSEISNWPNDEVLAEQIFPTMNAPDELAIMESTARGRKNFWHTFWMAAWEGKVEWTPVFIEFFRVKKYSLSIPEGYKFEVTKDEEVLRNKVKEKTSITITDEQFYWRRKKMEEFSALQGNEFKFYQEYPSATWMEAFQGSGVCAFNRRKLQYILETRCQDPYWYGEIELTIKGEKHTPKVRVVELWDKDDGGRFVKRKENLMLPAQEEYGGRLYMWEPPQEGETYYLGVDVAHGVPGGDFSVIQVIKIGHRTEPDEQVAEWRGWINPGPFAHVTCAMGYWYNGAQISIECNDVGQATNAEVMRVIQYENLFRWKHYDKIKNFMTDYFGWFTNTKTRDLIIAKFREYMDENMIILRSEWLIDECLDFSSVEGSRFEGQATHDDRVMAMMIALFCAHDSEWGTAAALAPRPKENPSELWKRKDFINSDFSPVHDSGKVLNVPNIGEQREVPKDFALHNELSVEENDAWRLL